MRFFTLGPKAIAPVAEETRPRKGHLAWIAAAMLAEISADFRPVATLRRKATPRTAKMNRFSVFAPDGTTIAPGSCGNQQIARSPDGRRLAYRRDGPLLVPFL